MVLPARFVILTLPPQLVLVELPVLLPSIGMLESESVFQILVISLAEPVLLLE